jgi:hypothetical protein
MKAKNNNKYFVEQCFIEHGITDFKRPLKDYYFEPKPSSVLWDETRKNAYYWFKKHGFEYTEPLANNLTLNGHEIKIGEKFVPTCRVIKNGYVGLITPYRKGGKWTW